MIEVKALTKRYDDVLAIDDLNFEIKKGEILGFLGPNGAGKTTTMKILTCFMPPTSGTATIKGLSIAEDSFSIRQLIGYLPENNPLYTEMTVYDYLEFVAKIRKIDQSKRRQKIKRVVELCGLGEVITKQIEECSKGYRQRVGLGQALIHEPELLILDEPTVGLDPTQIIEIRNLIKTLGKEITILMCSHILSEVSATCSRVFILKKGKIIADGTPKELTGRGKSKKTIYVELNSNKSAIETELQLFRERVDSVEELEGHNGFSRFKVQCAEDIRQKIFHLAVQKKWTIQELTMEETSLEEVFIDLTRDDEKTNILTRNNLNRN